MSHQAAATADLPYDLNGGAATLLQGLCAAGTDPEAASHSAPEEVGSCVELTRVAAVEAGRARGGLLGHRDLLDLALALEALAVLGGARPAPEDANWS